MRIRHIRDDNLIFCQETLWQKIRRKIVVQVGWKLGLRYPCMPANKPWKYVP